jgi:hypothetical protein
MKAIISVQLPNGTFSDVGMNSRFISGTYKSLPNLVRYLPDHIRSKTIRLELFHGDNIRGDSFATFIRTPDGELSEVV